MHACVSVICPRVPVYLSTPGCRARAEHKPFLRLVFAISTPGAIPPSLMTPARLPHPSESSELMGHTLELPADQGGSATTAVLTREKQVLGVGVLRNGQKVSHFT